MSRIEEAWKTIAETLGYDMTDPHHRGSPERIARFMKEWHTEGKDPPKLTTFPNDSCDQLVLTSGIRFYSLCAHHGLPFYGEAVVGYIPGSRVVGLSKLARVVDHYARRFQVQERITTDVSTYLQDELKPLGVGVILRAEHMCMSMRGIQRPGHLTTTSSMLGVFRDKPEARAEFLTLAAAGR